MLNFFFIIFWPKVLLSYVEIEKYVLKKFEIHIFVVIFVNKTPHIVHHIYNLLNTALFYNYLKWFEVLLLDSILIILNKLIFHNHTIIPYVHKFYSNKFITYLSRFYYNHVARITHPQLAQYYDILWQKLNGNFESWSN